MTALYIFAGLLLVAAIVLFCLWAGFATAEQANRPELAGVVALRFLLVVATVLVLGVSGGLAPVPLFAGFVIGWAGPRWAESVVDRPRKAVKR